MELPTYVQIEPVGQCNLRCQMCPVQFRKDGPAAFMPFEKYTRLIDAFSSLRHLHLQGLGEPMLHPRFFDMVAYAAGKGIRVTTNTNLTLLNASRAEKCVTSGLDELHGSIDGASAGTYESIRINAHFNKVLRNLQYLQQAKRKLNSEKPRIQVVMVVMRKNLHELPEVVRLAHRFQIDCLFVQHLCHDFGESSLPSSYKPMVEFVQTQTLLGEEPERVAHYFVKARALAEFFHLDLRLPRIRPKLHPPGTPGPKRCGWPWQGAYISYRGEAMPCCMISTPDRLNFGNMAQEGVDAVWNNKAYHQFRDALSSNEPPEICRSCAVYSGTF